MKSVAIATLPTSSAAEIRGLKSLGYSVSKITEKANCCNQNVKSMFYLLKNGHPSLIADVEHGYIPHTIALQISRTKSPELQNSPGQWFQGWHSQYVSDRHYTATRRQHNRDTRQPRSTERHRFHHKKYSTNEADARRQLIQRAKLVKSRLEFIAGALHGSCSPTGALSACYVPKAFIQCQVG